MRIGRFVVALAACLGVLPLSAQQGAQPEVQEEVKSREGAQEEGQLGQAPPEVVLGLRVESVRRGASHIPVLVLTPDARSFAEAIGHWRLDGRFPVLIDDGSAEATEHIARFVRAYGPERIVRWSAEPADPDDPDKPESIRELAGRVIDMSWTGQAGRSLGEAWTALKSAPPGVVVAREDDPAWVAAVALGAGRGQPVIWLEDGPLGVDKVLTKERADALAAEIEAGCDALGHGWGDSWDQVGDAIEAVTLCTASPARFRQGDEHFATTDRIGRRDGSAEPANRWAWSGQIFGSSVLAAYQAMCALFLPIEEAWLFDGYPSGEEPWDAYDLTAAGRELEQRGVGVTVHDDGSQSASHWRTLSARPLAADLVLVNTRGHAEQFTLRPGHCRSADVPFLSRPAAVCFVHSWSAQRPGDRRTIAGRWLERGAYAYFGSTHEPYLHAFMPPPALVQRLYAPAPLGAAARHRPAPLWKLAYFGDPLITPGPAALRVEKPLPLEGVESLEDELKALLEDGRYGDAARALVLLGRDADAVRLAEGVLKDESGAFAEVAPHVVLPAFRERERGLLSRAMGELDEAQARAAGRQDALWSAYWPRLGAGLEADVLRSLAANIRAGNEARDATELAPAMEAVLGREEAVAMLSRVRAGITNEQALKEIDAMLARLGG